MVYSWIFFGGVSLSVYISLSISVNFYLHFLSSINNHHSHIYLYVFIYLSVPLYLSLSISITCIHGVHELVFMLDICACSFVLHKCVILIVFGRCGKLWHNYGITSFQLWEAAMWISSTSFLSRKLSIVLLRLTEFFVSVRKFSSIQKCLGFRNFSGV